MDGQQERGGGKIKKRSSKHRKPYSRPSTKKSILTRVSDSVKNLFTPLTSFWYTRNNDVHDTSVDREDTDEQPTTSTHRDLPLTRSPLFSQHKQVEKMLSPAESPLNQKEFHKIFGKPKFEEKKSSSQMSLDKVESSSVASSSGCSSQLASKTEKVKSPVLWSSLGGSIGQPTERNGPTFNSSLLASDVGLTPSSNRSSFYSGRVSFGGAMNQSRNSIYQPSPYKIPQATKVQVRFRSSKSRINESSLNMSTRGAPISSTARKIMSTLEKMSTPLNDSKRIIINPDTSIPMIGRQANRRKTIGPSILATPKPPKRGLINTTDKIKSPKTPIIPLNKESATWSIANQVTPSTEAPQPTIARGLPAPLSSLACSAGPSRKSGGKMVRKTTSHYSSQPAPEEDNLPPLPVPSVPLTLPSNLPSFNFGRPGSTSTPAVARPPTRPPAPSQPTFTFATPTLQGPGKPPAPTTGAPTFHFSSPNTSINEGKKLDDEGIPSVTPAKPSPATTLKSGGVMDILGKTSGIPLSTTKTSKKWECEVCMVNNEEAKLKCVACEAPKPGSKPPTTKPPISGFTFGNPSSTGAKWECSVCMVNNANSRTSCAACEAPKPGSKTTTKIPTESEKPKFSFGAPIKSATKWECDSCMVQNDDVKDKCAACEAPKLKPKSSASASNASSDAGVSSKEATSQGRKTFTFGAPAAPTSAAPARWECDACMVFNEPSLDKCAACETPKPGAKPKTVEPAKTSGFKFGSTTSDATAAKPSGFKFGSQTNTKSAEPKKPFTFSAPKSTTQDGAKWDCQVCLVQNTDDKQKCAACETKRPGVIIVSPIKPTTQTTEKIPSWECDVCLVPNPGQRTTCVACESPKPGKSDPASKAPTFKFGFTSAPLTQPPPEDKKQPKPSFQFGAPVSTPGSSAGLNNAGSTNAAPAASEAPKFSGFKFGGKTVQPSDTKNAQSSEKTPTKRKAADEEQSAKQQIVANNNNTVSFEVTTAAKRPLSKASLFGSSQTPEQQKTPSFGSKQTQPKPPTYGSNSDSSKTMFGSTQPNRAPMFGQTTTQATTNAVTPSAPFQLSTTGPATMVQPSNTISAAPPAAAESKPAAAGFTFGASKPTPFGSNTTGKPSEPAPTGLPSFNFGAKPESTSNAKASFAFGSQKPVQAEPKPAAPVFAFGSSNPAQAQTAVEQKPNSGFAFGQSAPAAVAPAPAPAPPTFNFGASQSNSSNMFQTKETTFQATNQAPAFGSSVSKAPAFQFGASSDNPTNPKPSNPTPFQFGATAPQVEKPAGFQFGQTAPASSFVFGGNQQNTQSAGFQFGAQTSSNMFSNTPVPSQSTGTPGFQFGASQAPPQGNNSMFSIGAAPSKPSGRAGTPVQRTIRKANRRLKKN